MKKTGLIFLWISVGIFGFDWLSKFLIIKHLSLYESVNLLPIFNLTYVRNFGAAFSFLADHSGWQKFLFLSLAVIISVILTFFLATNPRSQRLQNWGYALIIGGALGNAYDRFTNGYVIDFLDFYYKQWHYPVFNFADVAICIGAGLLIIDTILKDKNLKAQNLKKKDQTRHK